MVYDLSLLLEAINRRLASNHGNDLSSIALSVGASRRTVERVVKQETGMSFARYRQTCLIKRALSLIKDETFQRSIKEIAFDLGYRSPAAFTRFVRCHTGQPPSAFRRRIARAPSRRKLATSAY